MADAKTRKQRMRERRQQAGMKAELVWLTPEAQAAMAALRRSGETVDAVFNRLLPGLVPTETSPVPSRVPSRVPKGVPRPEERAGYEERRVAIIARLGAMLLQGWQAIADTFNREGLATLSGRGKWDKGTVRNLWKKYRSP